MRASHLELFRFPGPEGMHPTELADRVGLSKQALNHLLNELESLGYLTRETTGTDGRHRVVPLTGGAWRSPQRRRLPCWRSKTS